ncbi:MAG: PCRF domain-containing protein, partial [Treponema sp.]|nr:PCRF domain-containing protein [Treponema sp.]
MNERLDSMLRRYEELSTLVQDPELVKNQNKYRDLMREYSQLGEIAVANNGIEILTTQCSDAKTLLQEEKDSDMRELAREEVKELEKRLQEAGEKL